MSDWDSKLLLLLPFSLNINFVIDQYSLVDQCLEKYYYICFRGIEEGVTCSVLKAATQEGNLGNINKDTEHIDSRIEDVETYNIFQPWN